PTCAQIGTGPLLSPVRAGSRPRDWPEIMSVFGPRRSLEHRAAGAAVSNDNGIIQRDPQDFGFGLSLGSIKSGNFFSRLARSPTSRAKTQSFARESISSTSCLTSSAVMRFDGAPVGV